MTQKAVTRANPLSKEFKPRSVRSLLLSVLATMLVPVFLMSFMQAYARLVQDRAMVQQNLLSAVTLSREQALHVIDSAKLGLEQVALRQEVRDATPTCSRTLAIAKLGMPYVTNLARVDARGLVMCSAKPLLLDPDMSGRAWWQNLSTTQDVSFFGPISSQVNKQAVLILGLALPGERDLGVGHVVLVLDLEALELGLQKRLVNPNAHLMLVDARGQPIEASGQALGEFKKEAGKKEAGKKENGKHDTQVVVGAIVPGQVNSARDNQGRFWSDVSAVLIPNKVYLTYSTPDDVSFSSTFWHMATDIALPLIALLLAGAGLWYSLQRWAIRPILELRAMAEHFAAGRLDNAPPPVFKGPIEMIELRDDMLNMAARIRQRDALLEKNVVEKDDLVKELHHRVKNNLQIIISLISLQARQLTTPQEKAPLERVHDRIAAMALVQRLIVETDTAATIDTCVLMDGLCNQIRRTYPKESLRVQLSIDSAHTQIPCDVATPLALFMFEAVTNAFRHGFPGDARGSIVAHFALSELGVAVLGVTDTGIGWTILNETTGTGHKLLQAFTRQLGGKLTLSSNEAEGSRVSVTFTIRSAQPILPSQPTAPIVLER